MDVLMVSGRFGELIDSFLIDQHPVRNTDFFANVVVQLISGQGEWHGYLLDTRAGQGLQSISIHFEFLFAGGHGCLVSGLLRARQDGCRIESAGMQARWRAPIMAMNQEREFDIVIAGGGMVGTSLARLLADLGTGGRPCRIALLTGSRLNQTRRHSTCNRSAMIPESAH